MAIQGAAESEVTSNVAAGLSEKRASVSPSLVSFVDFNCFGGFLSHTQVTELGCIARIAPLEFYFLSYFLYLALCSLSLTK